MLWYGFCSHLGEDALICIAPLPFPIKDQGEAKPHEPTNWPGGVHEDCYIEDAHIGFQGRGI